MNDYYLLYELLEWFNCARKAYHMHMSGGQHITQATQIREHARVLHAFANTTKKKVDDCVCIEASTMEDSSQQTLEAIKNNCQRIFHATLIADSMAIYVPYMHWNDVLKGWQFHIPAISMGGVRQDQLQNGVLLVMVCNSLSVPIAKIFLSYYSMGANDHEESWVDLDITAKIIKHYQKEYSNFTYLKHLINSEDRDKESYWHPCKKQYCEQCGVERTYTVDDIRTLRKAKQFIEELLSHKIKTISAIPDTLIPKTNVLNRQIQSVKTMQPIIIKDEVKRFITQLTYPRYFLDFEAFNTSIPYNFPPPYIKKPWGFMPFLFSLQWQDHPLDDIHTMLWSLLPGNNNIERMWNALKNALVNAGSIVVYGKHFESNMIQQLANFCHDNQLGDEIQKKLVDLQQVFFNLSAYHPEQKGKISLKTISRVWVNGTYSSFRVHEGIAANYYFTRMVDTALDYFKDMPMYVRNMFEMVHSLDSVPITIKDIASYCKYDTEVMIRIIAVLEKIVETDTTHT